MASCDALFQTKHSLRSLLRNRVEYGNEAQPVVPLHQAIAKFYDANIDDTMSKNSSIQEIKRQKSISSREMKKLKSTKEIMAKSKLIKT